MRIRFLAVFVLAASFGASAFADDAKYYASSFYLTVKKETPKENLDRNLKDSLIKIQGGNGPTACTAETRLLNDYNMYGLPGVDPDKGGFPYWAHWYELQILETRNSTPDNPYRGACADAAYTLYQQLFADPRYLLWDDDTPIGPSP
jgi:hypothetical protein